MVVLDGRACRAEGGGEMAVGVLLDLAFLCSVALALALNHFTLSPHSRARTMYRLHYVTLLLLCGALCFARVILLLHCC